MTRRAPDQHSENRDDPRPLAAHDPVTGRDGRDDGSIARGYLVSFLISVPLTGLVVLLVWVLSR